MQHCSMMLTVLLVKFKNIYVNKNKTLSGFVIVYNIMSLRIRINNPQLYN